MAYVVNALLGSLKAEIFDGIKSGRFERWGGLIRVAAGYPRAGSIVTMLRDVPRLAAQTAPALLERTVSTVLQLSSVAAAASVVNLGVSVAGFALLAHKLHRLQTSVASIIATNTQHHDDTMARIAGLQTQLVELRMLGLQHHDLLDEALAGIRALRNDLLAEHLARMTATLERLQEHGADRSDKAAGEPFRVARHWLHHTISEAGTPGSTSPQWFDLLRRYRVWCFASASEIQLARFTEDGPRAADLARKTATQARTWATAWQHALVPPTELGGILRFGHQRFAALSDEVYPRLLRLRGDSTSETTLDAAHAAAEVAAKSPDDQWFAQQHALADTLDFLEETVERLESLAGETAWCQERRLGWSRWEALPLPTESAGIGLIDVRGAA